jgi:hypothetical protein
MTSPSLTILGYSKVWNLGRDSGPKEVVGITLHWGFDPKKVRKHFPGGAGQPVLRFLCSVIDDWVDEAFDE